jgi:DNA invertase Pin-like site-specific DNA recombinase
MPSRKPSRALAPQHPPDPVGSGNEAHDGAMPHPSPVPRANGVGAALSNAAQRRGRVIRSRSESVAVGYLRRSTDRQEQSIPDQKRAVEAYCAQHGFRLLRCYVDDAISGTSTIGRKGFQAMIADAQAPGGAGFNAIVVYDVKRFGRVDNDEAGYYRHLLRSHGIEVRYASENFAGDGTDDLLRPVKQWQAREESKDLSKVTIRGLLSRSSTGFWMGGAPPLGYDLRYESQSGQFLVRVRYNADGTKAVLDDDAKLIRTLDRGESIAVSRRDRCRLVLGDPARVEVVRRIFRMYVNERRGFKAIADALNRDRVPTARNRSWAAHYSGQWSMTTVRAVILNPAYCGDMVWNRHTDARFHRIEQGRAVTRDEALGRRLEPNQRSDWIVVKDAHPAIVIRRLWEQAQKRLIDNPASSQQRGLNPRTGAPVAGRGVQTVGGWTGPRARFLLSGLCSCVRCSSRYEGYTTRSTKAKADGTRTKWYTYSCGAAIRRGPSVCRFGSVPQAALESAVIAAVLGYYERFNGPKGRKRLQDAARGTLGDQYEAVQRERQSIAKRQEKIATTIANLLDNITPANRQLADERLAHLGKERDRLIARSADLESLTMSEHEVRNVVAETHAFLGSLAAVLRGEDFARRQAAVRRCVQRVWVDSEHHAARVEVFKLPAVTWRPEGAATETLNIALALPDHCRNLNSVMPVRRRGFRSAASAVPPRARRG